MNAYELLYEAELEKLRQLAVNKDWSLDGELRWGRQLIATKDAYLTMCYEEAKAKGVWKR